MMLMAMKKLAIKFLYGSRILFDDGDKVEATQKLAEWDPFTIPIITEKQVAKFIDLVDRISNA